MISYSFERATYNGISGWFCTRRINNVYAGKQFGRTKRDAIAQFNTEDCQ